MSGETKNYVYLKMGECIIGRWKMPGEDCSNFDNQKDLGWHVFYGLMEHDEVVAFKADPEEQEKKGGG